MLGRTIIADGLKPQRPRVQYFVENTKFPESKNALQRYLGVFKLLKNDEKVLVAPDLLVTFTEIMKTLDRCFELALKQPMPNKKRQSSPHDWTGANYAAVCYVVLIEDDPQDKYTSTRNTFAPVAYRSKTSSPTQLKMSIYDKEFLALFLAFKGFGHICWGTPRPVIILTGNKLVTRLFKTKIVPSL